MAGFSRRGFLRAGLSAPFILSAAGAESDSGSVDLSLEARQDWVQVGGRFGYLYSFDGKIPGPVINAKSGDEVRIAFRNRLPEATNLHFHGLQIPSTGNADNVTLRIPSGESINYQFTIPRDHPSGTFWYHPHLHGSAARQVSRGLVGVFVVRNDADLIPEIEMAPEATLVLQDFSIDNAGRPFEPNLMERMQGREGPLVTVSGQENPEFLVQQDGWLRLRILNASSSRFYRLRLEEHPLYVIAVDSGFLNAPDVRDEVLLSPGERVEVMVKGERPPGEYRLLSLPYNRGGIGMMGSTQQRGAFSLARVRYDGRVESPWDLPSRLATVVRLPEPSVRRVFQLGQGMGMGMGMMGGGMTFTINGRVFDERRVDVRAAFGTVEQWEFLNPTGMDHPMHIHTNPFQVLDSTGTPVPAWKDTVLVRSRSRLAVRTAFREHSGLRMFHCHILDHEDLGMMGTIDVA